MATDIVGSLFGVTPEMLQQRQMEMADRQALEYAQMSPLQRASYGIARGGYQLAGALGGQDPQLRMISNRNAIARQIDPTDPQSMRMGIQALQQAGDSVGAMQLAAVYQQRMKVLSDIAQSEAAAASSAASTGKTLAETQELQRKAREEAEARREYFGGSAGQSTSAAQSAAATTMAMPTQSAVSPETRPADKPVASEVVFPTKDAIFSRPANPVSEDDANRINRLITDYNRSMQLANGETPWWYASTKPITEEKRKVEADIAENIKRGLEVLYGVSLVRPYGTPSTTPRSQVVASTPAATNVAPSTTAPAPAPAVAAAPSPATSTRIAEIEARLAAIRRPRAAGVRDAELEGKQLEDELKSIREASKPTEIERLVARREELIAKGAQPDSPSVQAISGRIASLQGREVRFGEQREAYAADQFGKPFAQLTQAQQKAINDRVDAESAKPRTTITNVLPEMPGDRRLADIPAFRRSVQATIDPQLKSIDAADQALRAIDDSIKTNNFVSFNAARVQLAKALGDSQLSRRDVEQAGGDPSLLGGLYDATSRLFTGTPSLDTQSKIKATLNAIRTVADRKARSEIDVQRDIALRTPGYDPAAVERALSFPQLSAAGAGSGAGSLAEQARAELARRQAERK